MACGLQYACVSRHLGNAVKFWASWNGDGRSIVTETTTLTWRDLHRRTNALARGLVAAGVRRGDRVGILANNCAEYIELAVAGYKVGSILVPLNMRLVAPELRYIIDHAGCTMVIADGSLTALAAAACASSERPPQAVSLDGSWGNAFDSLRHPDDSDYQADIGDDEVCYLCYTSGTTGQPKGAMLTHGNIIAMATNRILCDNATTNSVAYLPFPLAFTGGIVSMWAPFHLAGATLVLDAAVDALRTLEVIQRERITHYSAVPVIWEMIVNHPELALFDLTSLQVIGSGGASVPKVLIERLRAAGLPMSQGYGLTEGCGVSSWLNAADAERKIGSCGRPLMHTRMRAVDDAGIDVAANEVGELLISGPEIMVGYWNNEEATASTLVDGWLHTGDLARIDDEGFVYIVDRAKDMLISGGLNVYPAEVERVIAGYPGVSEVAVIGIPDDKWGEVPMAIVGARSGAHLETAAIVAYCRAELADYKVPKRVVLRDEPLPRGMSGKVLKRELRAGFGAPNVQPTTKESST